MAYNIPMDLGAYLQTNKLSQAQMASRLDVSQGAVNRYVLGLRMPRPAILRRIERVTDHKVTAEDFLTAFSYIKPNA